MRDICLLSWVWEVDRTGSALCFVEVSVLFSIFYVGIEVTFNIPPAAGSDSQTIFTSAKVRDTLLLDYFFKRAEFEL
jgi:hypothetical protein